MELLVWLGVAVVVNAACMAQLMRLLARRMRDWRLKTVEAFALQARASLAGLLCVLLLLFGLGWLPRLAAELELSLSLFAFYVPYYFWLRHIAYRLTKTQIERGRGVARRNVREIAQATFGCAFTLYGLCGAALYLLWSMANQV